jgi:hypothetical protein
MAFWNLPRFEFKEQSTLFKLLCKCHFLKDSVPLNLRVLQKSKSIFCDSLTYLCTHLGTSLEKEWTNPGCQVPQTPKFRTVTPNTCRYSAHKLLHVIKLGWPGSTVGIATGYGLDGSGIESRWRRNFTHLSRPALGSTQPPVQWVPGLFRGKERPGHDADPSPPSSAVVKKG